MKKIIRDYWIEVLFGVLASSGVFLMAIRVEIHEILLAYLKHWLDATAATASRTGNSFDAFITSLSLYNLVGFVLFLTALIILLYRQRRRYLKSVSWQDDTCPRCKGHIHRIHRTRLDRLWGVLMRRPLYRYQCAQQACDWSGLRYGKPHEHRRESGNSQSFQSNPKSLQFRK
jgi:hypothetical protein